MFLEFYKLREQPFGVTPDPRFLYFGSTHREGLASLLYAVEAKRGFSALVAEPGMGKSRLLHEFRQRIGKERAFVLSGSCSPDGQQTPFLPFIEVVCGSESAQEHSPELIET